MLIRIGDRAGAEGGGRERGERMKAPPRAPARKTKDAVDCRQNNKTLYGIALRLPHNAVAVPTAMQNRVAKTISP